MLDPLTEALTPEMANRIVNLRPTTTESERMEQLASLANEGALPPNEEAEYRTRITLGDLISVLKLKARRYLNQNSS